MAKPPLIKPSRRGLLHEKLGVPQGQKIPAVKIAKALTSKSPALRKEANFARNFGKGPKAPTIMHPGEADPMPRMHTPKHH